MTETGFARFGHCFKRFTLVYDSIFGLEFSSELSLLRLLRRGGGGRRGRGGGRAGGLGLVLRRQLLLRLFGRVVADFENVAVRAHLHDQRLAGDRRLIELVVLVLDPRRL